LSSWAAARPRVLSRARDAGRHRKVRHGQAGQTVAGVRMLITISGAGLTIVMAAMAVLWLMATIHHNLLAKTGLPQQAYARQPAGHKPRSAGAC
jgi:hypothetical protein